MKLQRQPHEPSALVDFYQESLEQLGAVCERTWYDRLQLVAEGSAAKLWNADGALHEIELCFPPADATGPRDAVKEVFPGCPLTFHLAETLRPHPLSIERAILRTDAQAKPPGPDVAERLWHAQRPGATRWRLEAPFFPAHHFSLLALVRCEVQAIDQHWSLHRLVIALADGARDESLAQALHFLELDSDCLEPISFPAPDLARWHELLRAALQDELSDELASIRARQERYLRRELDRIDDYFETYERELSDRAARTGSETTKMKTIERQSAAKSEHARRRHDQVQRHEIRVIPHLDALLLLAEPAWRATVCFQQHGHSGMASGLFVPRVRRWVMNDSDSTDV